MKIAIGSDHGGFLLKGIMAGSIPDYQLSAGSMDRNGSLMARVQLRNIGSRAGSEVAQLYVRQLAGSAGPRPVRELKGFRKVKLEQGASQTIEFKISGRELGYYSTDGLWVVDPGKYWLWISKDSASGEPVEFEVHSQ